MADYKRKLQNLRLRREDVLTKALLVTESFNKNEYGDSTTYALEAMEPINAGYTKKTYEACDRIKNQLKPGLKEYGIEVDFRYQGSVPNNIHIKLYSDIDLLSIHQSFITLQPPQKTDFPYEGNPVEDLKEMRKKIFRILDTVYSAAKIDDKGSKALSISGGSLNRKIDIICSNWYDSMKFTETKDEDYRGVNILDRDKSTRILNYPFMHIYWLNEKDNRVGGNEKRLIRLLKTIKVDADDEIKVSSYDIASLVYRMDDADLKVSNLERLKLLNNCNGYLKKVINDVTFSGGLYVANSTRKIFCEEGAKIGEVVKLQKELEALIVEIVKEVKPLYDSLEKSNIYYQ